MSDKNKIIKLSENDIRSIIREEIVVSNSKTLNEDAGDQSCDATASGRGYGGNIFWNNAKGFYSPVGGFVNNKAGNPIFDIVQANAKHVKLFPGDRIAQDDLEDIDRREDYILNRVIPLIGRNQNWATPPERPSADQANQPNVRIRGFINLDMYAAILDAATKVWGQIDDDILESVGLSFTGKDVLDYIQNPEGASSTVVQFLKWNLAERPINGLAGICKILFTPLAPGGSLRNSSSGNKTSIGKFRLACEKQVQRWADCKKPNTFPSWFKDAAYARMGADLTAERFELEAAKGSAASQLLVDRMSVVAFEGPNGEVFCFPASELDRTISGMVAQPSAYWSDSKRHIDAIANQISQGDDMSPLIIYSNLRRLLFKDRTPNLLVAQAGLGNISEQARSQVGGGTQEWGAVQWAGFVGLFLFGPAAIMGVGRLAGLGCRMNKLKQLQQVNIAGRGATITRVDGVPLIAGEGSTIWLASGESAAYINAMSAGANSVNFTRGSQMAAKIRKSKIVTRIDDESEQLLKLQAQKKAKTIDPADLPKLAALEKNVAVAEKALEKANQLATLSSRSDNLVSMAMAQWQMARAGGSSASVANFLRDTLATVRTYVPFSRSAGWSSAQAGAVARGITATMASGAAVGKILTGTWTEWLQNSWSYYTGTIAFSQLPEEFQSGIQLSDSRALSNYLRSKASSTENPQMMRNIAAACDLIARKARNPNDFTTRGEIIAVMEKDLSFGTGRTPSNLRFTEDEKTLFNQLESGTLSGALAADVFEDDQDDTIREATNGEVLNAIARGDIGDQYVSILPEKERQYFQTNERYFGYSQSDRSRRQQNIERIVEENIAAAGGSLQVSFKGEQYTISQSNVGDLPIWLQYGSSDGNNLYDTNDINVRRRIVEGTSINVEDAGHNFSFLWSGNNIDI